MLIPGENMWSRSARGGLYLFCLLYVFLGVAIVADVFMNAIETVTSATKMVSTAYPLISPADKGRCSVACAPRSRARLQGWRLTHRARLRMQVTKTRADGTVEEEEQKVWNDTIANLSLMALGSSAPEILLSVIGVVTALGEEADGTSRKHGLFLRAVPTPKRRGICAELAVDA
jgi:solute carrier family 8 (sodium/calcium exchanger)